MSILKRSTTNQGKSLRRIQNEFKAFLVRRLGGKCMLCGYHKHLAALEFDHIDPSTKTTGIAILINKRKWKEAIEEAEKCRILCANCHREQTHARYGEDNPIRVYKQLRSDHPAMKLGLEDFFDI